MALNYSMEGYMEKLNLDKSWILRRCYLDSVGMLDMPGTEVNLPHDAMIETPVSEDAPGNVDSGFFNGTVCCYTKYVEIPKEWEKETVGLYFDGAMMNATVDINGYRVAEHHYGYTPFFINITDYVAFGEENRITVNTNTGVQPSSRWYTGAGLIRSVSLCHSPKVYVPTDGIYAYTKEIDGDMAFLEMCIDIKNDTIDDRMALVQADICEEGSDEVLATVSRNIQVNKQDSETARMAVTLRNPKLWTADTPNLYTIKVTVKNTGVYRTRFMAGEETIDKAEVLFGVRTITVDAVRGLRINGKTVKLKGGCVHHDNGLLGAVSLYEAEARKVRKLKEIGFNAIRTAHNPASAALIEACDREGMYVFEEAYDAWGIAKRVGDFSNYFSTCWKQEIEAFMRRDRVHPAVIMWSTGNEIPERGGLNHGYSLATKLAETMRSLDSTRPISNGICSLWSGLDDKMARGMDLTQNAMNDGSLVSWEDITEPFTNGLDVVGCNYMEGQYEKDHEMYPDRVILGSENFPREIGFRWPFIEEHDYVIGDFTWTAWDYIGEAGIGKSLFLDPDDPIVKEGPWAVMPQRTSFYPWRLANDADVDITGYRKPQGEYRSIVWGSDKTSLYTIHPKNYGKVEVIGMWGFTDVQKSWNYSEYVGKPIEVVVFTKAQEVELIVNGEAKERKAVSFDKPLPDSVRFDTVYVPGIIEAVSYTDGVEVSRDVLVTTKEAVEIRLTPEKTSMKADGHDLINVSIEAVDEDGRVVPDADLSICASIEGAGILAAVGTGNPITEEIYTDSTTRLYKGRALAVIRSGYEAGKAVLKVEASNGVSASIDCTSILY